MSKVLLIDYENVQGINLRQIDQTGCKVHVFTGSSQSKIPIDLVSSAQAFGDRLEWIRIDGNGPNALDFHIAYYLGVQIAKCPTNEYFILSKDKGFDPLIKHIIKGKVICRRIGSISEIGPGKKAKGADGDYEKVVKNLIKIEKGQRPRNKRTLRQYLKTLVSKPQTEEKVDRIIEQLFASKLVSDDNGRLIYKI
jgi:hypothetical protein